MPSPDHIIRLSRRRAAESRVAHNTERLGDPEVHDHLEFCWKLNGQIAGLLE